MEDRSLETDRQEEEEMRDEGEVSEDVVTDGGGSEEIQDNDENGSDLNEDAKELEKQENGNVAEDSENVNDKKEYLQR